MYRRFLLVWCLLSVPLAFAAGGAGANPTERTLANGLRVIVKEDRRAPTVAHLRVGTPALARGDPDYFPLRIDSNRKLLNEWAIVGFYRLPETWLADFPRAVERVTAADVRAAFARHVRPERFVTVVVGADEGK